MIGCGRPNPADRPVSPDQSLDFAVLYGQNCAGCHGKDGKLGPAPPLNDPLFRAIVPEEELENVITKGRKQALMPAFAKENGGNLTKAQIRVLVLEIKGILYKIVKEHDDDAKVKLATLDDFVIGQPTDILEAWGAPANPHKGMPSYLAPPASSKGGATGDTKLGAAVYLRACAACHGDHGQGIQEGDKMVRTIHEPALLALISNQVLRRYAITGRPDLGMPNYSQPRPDNKGFVPLTDQDVADLTALLASWRTEK